MPIVQVKSKDIERKITTQPKVECYATLRKARLDKKLRGIREKEAREKAEEEKAKK
jgi:large subunit ribosomal protein L13e